MKLVLVGAAPAKGCPLELISKTRARLAYDLSLVDRNLCNSNARALRLLVGRGKQSAGRIGFARSPGLSPPGESWKSAPVTVLGDSGPPRRALGHSGARMRRQWPPPPTLSFRISQHRVGAA